MQRRTALSTLTIAATPLLVSVSAPSAFAAAKSGGTTDYKQHTLMIGTLSKEMSEIALKKASNGKVKEFAGFEDDEQTAVARVLTNKMNPPPAELDAEHKKILSQLRDLSGAKFDQQYIKGQIDGHQQLKKIQEAYLESGKSEDMLHIARLADMVIKMHLTMLSDLQAMLKA